MGARIAGIQAEITSTISKMNLDLPAIKMLPSHTWALPAVEQDMEEENWMEKPEYFQNLAAI